DKLVTGVQTCALPISILQLGGWKPTGQGAERHLRLEPGQRRSQAVVDATAERQVLGGARPGEREAVGVVAPAVGVVVGRAETGRSEERRVGKESRSRW